MVSLLNSLALALLVHLLGQQRPHLRLLASLLVGAALVEHTFPHFPLKLVSLEILLFLVHLLLLGLDNSASHAVHKLLRTTLARQEFPVAILLLLGKNSHVLFLRGHVHFLLILFVLLSSTLADFVLDEHLLQVVTFLLTLLSLESPLSIHLSAQTVNHFDLLLVSIFLFVSPLALFFIQLPIT